MMQGDPRLDRLYTKFGEDTVKAIKYLLSGRSEVPEELEHIEHLFTSDTRNIILKRFREEVNKRAKSINASSLVTRLNDIYNGNKNE